MKNRYIENRGDELIIESEVRLSGKFRLSNFTDSVVGSPARGELLREFRYSIDGLFWSDWSEITTYNLSNTTLSSESFVVFQVRYKKLKDGSKIEVNEFVFFGNRIETKKTVSGIAGSQFEGIWDSERHKAMSQNLFKKLYFRGILPTYITRSENRSYKEDEGFIDFFMSIAKFFALFFLSHERFEGLANDRDLLFEYVKQNGLFINEDNYSEEELKTLLQTYMSEVRKRGTMSAYRKGGEIGEFLKLLKNGERDEFLVSNLPLEAYGWCVGKSSPLYRGIGDLSDLSKTSTEGKCFKSLEDHMITKSSGASVSVDEESGRGVLNVTLGGVSNAGLGRLSSDFEVMPKHIILVESRLDYEVSFFVKKKTADHGCKIKFGIEGFNNLRAKLFDSFIDASGIGYISEEFMEIDLDNLREDTWYRVSGVLRGYSCHPIPNDRTELGIGRNLIFNNQFVKFISPVIQVVSDGGGANVHLWGYSVKPLVWGKNIMRDAEGNSLSHSMGFLQPNRVLYIAAKNNNKTMSQEEIENLNDKYFMPYNQSGIITFL